MGATFVVYLDESGDEGFRFASGSSEWFVLSAVITRKAKEFKVDELVDKVRYDLGKSVRKPLHFRDLKHAQRLPYVSEIAKADLYTISVIIHKPSIKEPENFQKRYRLYFYSVRLLLERVSWLCRDNIRSGDIGDRSAEIIFSNRSGMSYTELKNYLSLLQKRSDFSDIQIDWSVIKTAQIKALPHNLRRGLQIADAVASGFWSAVQPSRHGFTEDRYARMLKPVVYHRKGRYLGYGLKFWPHGVEDLIKDTDGKSWVESEFK